MPEINELRFDVWRFVRLRLSAPVVQVWHVVTLSRISPRRGRSRGRSHGTWLVVLLTEPRRIR